MDFKKHQDNALCLNIVMQRLQIFEEEINGFILFLDKLFSQNRRKHSMNVKMSEACIKKEMKNYLQLKFIK